MLKKSAVLFALGIALLVLAGFFLPPEFELEQSLVIRAKPENIHRYVSDLKQWPKWSPWKEMVPDKAIRYGNVTMGVGASQTWRGKSDRGRLHITASSPQNGIAYDIYVGESSNPSISAIEYKKNSEDSTIVTWRIHREINAPVLGGYLALFVKFKTQDMYQKGLSKLKSVVEQADP